MTPQGAGYQPSEQMNFEEGDIIAVSEKGIKHGIDRILQRTEWHHVFLYIGNGMALDASPMAGCHTFKINLTHEKYNAYRVLRHATLAIAERKKLVKKAVSTFLGQKFSFSQVYRIIISRIILADAKNSPDTSYKCDTRRLICSNMISMAYHLAGHPLKIQHKPEYTMPEDYGGELQGFKLVVEHRFSRR